MNQYLVNDNLKKHRGSQCKQIQRHGSDNNIPEGGLLVQYFWNKPAQTKWLVEVSQRMISLQENNIAIPRSTKSLPIEPLYDRHVGQRIKNCHLAFALSGAHAYNNYSGTVSTTSQYGEHPPLSKKTIPGKLFTSRLQAHLVSHTENQRKRWLFISQCIFVDQSLRIDLQPMMLGNCSQALNNCVGKFISHHYSLWQDD